MNIKTKNKIQALFCDMFPEEENKEENKEELTEYMVMDFANVLSVEPKTEDAKYILEPFQKVKFSDMLNKLEFKDKGQYSTTYILTIFKIIKILEKDEPSIKLGSGLNVPLLIETEDFKFYLAPRYVE